MSKVSVIVPVYNVEAYLEEALDSAVRQTLRDIEIICINDGSTDGSLDILKKYAAADDRIRIVDKKNEGYGVGMNIGLDLAEGEYIGILEPDDYLTLTMFEDLYNIAVENDLDFVKADFYRFSRDEATGDMSLIYNRLDPGGEFYGRVVCPYDSPEVTKFTLNTWSGIYKREFIERYHIRHNVTPGASFQDNGFFWQTFIYAKRGMFINKPYYMNRRDNPNSSVNAKDKVYAINVEYDFIYDIFMKEGNEERWERFKAYYTRKKYHSYVFTLGRIGDDYKKEYVERFSRVMKRARDLGELDYGVLTSFEHDKIELLINNPQSYYKKYVENVGRAPATREEKLERDLRDIRNSKAYKIGNALMKPARAVKKIVK